MGIAEPLLHPPSGEAAGAFCPQYGKFPRSPCPQEKPWLCQPVPGTPSVALGARGLLQCRHSLLSTLSVRALSEGMGL